MYITLQNRTTGGVCEFDDSCVELAELGQQHRTSPSLAGMLEVNEELCAFEHQDRTGRTPFIPLRSRRDVCRRPVHRVGLSRSLTSRRI